VSIAARAAVPLLVLGVAGLVLGGIAGAQLRRAMPFGPPLVSPSGLAVDRDGRVYAGTDADRIHVYDGDGRFLRGWYLDANAGPVRIRIDDGGLIEIATAESGRLHVFDRDGQLVRTHADAGAWQRFGATQDHVAVGAGGPRGAIGAGAGGRAAPPPRRRRTAKAQMAHAIPDRRASALKSSPRSLARALSRAPRIAADSYSFET
jgi:hypothetical protein